VEVELKIDGENVPLNEYVVKVFSGVVEALVSTLHGIPEDWKNVEMKVKR